MSADFYPVLSETRVPLSLPVGETDFFKEAYLITSNNLHQACAGCNGGWMIEKGSKMGVAARTKRIACRRSCCI